MLLTDHLFLRKVSEMYQSKISSIIIRLKKAKNNNPEMTLQRISEETGVSMSTLKRVFADGSENQSFRYDSLKPICQFLLGTDGLDDDMDYEEFQIQLAGIKEKYEKKLEKERDQYRRNKDFLMHQIELKDKRIDILFETVEDQKEQYNKLHQQYVDVMQQLLNNQKLIEELKKE